MALAPATLPFPSSPELGESWPEMESPSKITQYHKITGRPVRRSAGRIQRVDGYVDSNIISDASDLSSDDDKDGNKEADVDEDELGEDEDEDGDEQTLVFPLSRKRKRSPSPPPPPLDPVIRDERRNTSPDSETDTEPSDSRMPPVTLQFNIPLGFHGPLVVKLDHKLLVADNQRRACLTKMRRSRPKSADSKWKPSPKQAHAQKLSFTDLPAELRNTIYRLLFVRELPCNFPATRPFCRSSQFLSTCRMVQAEGCSILYGENTFTFDRNRHTRGPYWEPNPKEIGYTDVRRFLNAIGPENLCYLRVVRIVMEDASPSSTPELSHEERRYINDVHLMDCLRILRMTRLRTLTLIFLGRRSLGRTDVKILGYLERIKADEVLSEDAYSSSWYHPKIWFQLWSDLKSAMERKEKLYSEH